MSWRLRRGSVCGSQSHANLRHKSTVDTLYTSAETLAARARKGRPCGRPSRGSAKHDANTASPSSFVPKSRASCDKVSRSLAHAASRCATSTRAPAAARARRDRQNLRRQPVVLLFTQLEPRPHRRAQSQHLRLHILAHSFNPRPRLSQ